MAYWIWITAGLLSQSLSSAIYHPAQAGRAASARVTSFPLAGIVSHRLSWLFCSKPPRKIEEFNVFLLLPLLLGAFISFLSFRMEWCRRPLRTARESLCWAEGGKKQKWLEDVKSLINMYRKYQVPKHSHQSCSAPLAWSPSEGWGHAHLLWWDLRGWESSGRECFCILMELLPLKPLCCSSTAGSLMKKEEIFLQDNKSFCLDAVQLLLCCVTK